MKFAIKRQEIVDKIMLGYGTVGNAGKLIVTTQYDDEATDVLSNEVEAE